MSNETAAELINIFFDELKGDESMIGIGRTTDCVNIFNILATIRDTVTEAGWTPEQLNEFMAEVLNQESATHVLSLIKSRFNICTITPEEEHAPNVRRPARRRPSILALGADAEIP